MRLQPGIRLGAFDIIDALGSGGMGEVYRARDSRLDRDVAIKVLPERLAGDPQALARFEREAKAVAALSHPNILALYDMGTHENVSYAVTELLEGETLRARLTRSEVAWRRAVEIGIAVTEGLAAVHAKGIVHRDLKPENIFLTSDGRVKILDFGLARWQPVGATADSSSPTETSDGTVVGTAGYMSPEQIRGEAVDARSDIFSLGCVLYEMVAGRRAFACRTAPETMAAVLKEDPPHLADFGKEIPGELQRIVHHCLEKTAEQRFQSAQDLAFGLRAVSGTDRAVATAPPPRRRERLQRWAWTAAASVLLIVAGLLIWRATDAAAIDSLAVLPFANVGGDPNQEYLSEGLAENLINSLSQVPKLRVTARSLAFRYRGPQVDPQKAGRDLNVRVVLTGRMIERDGALNVQVDLVYVGDGSQLWGRQYSRHFSEILDLQEEITREVSEKLRLKTTALQQKRLAKRATQNTDAYQAYLKGRYYWNRRTEPAIKRAVDYFLQAIKQDPAYAQAFAGLADCYVTYIGYQVEPPLEAGPKAQAAAARALEIDNTLADAHTSLGFTKVLYERDWAGAEREFQRAIELDPNYPTAPHWYSIYLAAVGRNEQAVAAIRRAQQLDPLSLVIGANVGLTLFFARRYDEAIEQTSKALDMDPSFVPGHWWLSLPYEQKAMFQDAIAELQKAHGLSKDSPYILGPLGHAYAVSGDREKARQVLTELGELSKRRYVAAFDTALIYTGLGDNERAFEWLEKSLKDRSWGMTYLKVDPRFDHLRPIQRFAELMRQMGLEP
jgi:serine/threonine-protein kinase